MSSTPVRASVPGMFLGGYLLFFLGVMASFLAGIELPRSASRQGPQATLSRPQAVGVLGVGVVLASAGSLLLAKAPPLERSQFSFLIVCMIMTPIPFAVATGINYLGDALRRAWAGLLQAVLLGAAALMLG